MKFVVAKNRSVCSGSPLPFPWSLSVTSDHDKNSRYFKCRVWFARVLQTDIRCLKHCLLVLSAYSSRMLLYTYPPVPPCRLNFQSSFLPQPFVQVVPSQCKRYPHRPNSAKYTSLDRFLGRSFNHFCLSSVSYPGNTQPLQDKSPDKCHTAMWPLNRAP